MTIQRAEIMYGVNPKLVAVILGVGQHKDFCVTCGLRTREEQAAAVAAGKSQTMKSYHLTGDAVDLACLVKGVVSWEWSLYEELNKVVQEYAGRHGVTITWGGSWRTLKDGPHFQIERLTEVKAA